MRITDTKTNPNFHAGLTKQIKQEINSCDVGKISREFAKYGIPTDFKENKIVAWCCLKSLEINRALRLNLPNMINVEDFSKLDVDEKAIGFCNVAPSDLYLDNDTVVKEHSVFFNQNYDWEQLDEKADKAYENSQHSTDFFLETFIHEFAHAAHFKNLVSIMDGIQYVKKILRAIKPENLDNLDEKFPDLKDLCNYAITSPFEFVACDLSNRTIQNLNKDSLKIKKNFIPTSPYGQNSFLKLFTKKDDIYKQAEKFWNGDLIV